MFTVQALPWSPPPAAEFDAVMLTSANAARRAGAGLAGFLGLPCYAVGEATAAAASDAGFADVRVGPEDGVALLMVMEGDGVARALHPCGADHITLEPDSTMRPSSMTWMVSAWRTVERRCATMRLVLPTTS